MTDRHHLALVDLGPVAQLHLTGGALGVGRREPRDSVPVQVQRPHVIKELNEQRPIQTVVPAELLHHALHVRVLAQLAPGTRADHDRGGIPGCGMENGEHHKGNAQGGGHHQKEAPQNE